jgi:hypothetical protein
MAEPNIAIYIGLSKLLAQTKSLDFEGTETDLTDVKKALELIKDNYDMPDEGYKSFLSNIKLGNAKKVDSMTAEALGMTIESSMKSNLSVEMSCVISLIEEWEHGDFPSFELNTKCNYLKNIANFAEVDVGSFIVEVKEFAAFRQAQVSLIRIVEHASGWEFYVKACLDSEVLKGDESCSDLLGVLADIASGDEVSAKKIHSEVEPVILSIDLVYTEKQEKLKNIVDQLR